MLSMGSVLMSGSFPQRQLSLAPQCAQTFIFLKGNKEFSNSLWFLSLESILILPSLTFLILWDDLLLNPSCHQLF